MPRKTKKKKIIADYRKRLSKLEKASPVSSVKNSASQNPEKKPKKEKPASVLTTIDQAAFAKQKAMVMRDLKKTLILSALAIGSLVVISLVPLR